MPKRTRKGKQKVDDEVEDDEVLELSDEEEEEQEQEQEESRYDQIDEDNDEEGGEEEDSNFTFEEKENEADIGIIEAIELVNFMCHRHLKLTLGPNINFIVGVNGSGKSAVLVALTVCLGAKAGFTNRASKLNELIRGGASSATISVRLRNRGGEAYKPELFGESIIIERRLSRDGAAQYKIKSATGNIVSSTAGELQMILEQFNIQVNNPCAILMQDTSRQFLNSSRAQDKYELFLKATQLDQMKKDFEDIHKDQTEKMILLSKKKTLLPEMQKQVDELEREFKEMQQVRDWEAQVRNFKNMLAWAYVVEDEQNITTLKRDIDTERKGISNHEKKIAEITASNQENDHKYEEKNKELNAFNEQVKVATSQTSEIEAQIRELKKEESKAGLKVNDLKKKIEAVKRRRDAVLRNIRETEDRIAKAAREDKETKSKEIQVAKDKLARLQQETASIRENKDKIFRKLEEVVHKIRELEAKLTEYNTSKRNLQDEIQTLKRKQKDKLQVFGQKTPELLNAITNNHRRFRKTPIGPLGMKVELSVGLEWALGVETAITTQTLKSFVVDNVEDEKSLKELCNKTNVRPPAIITTKFVDQPYQGLDEPPPNFLTALRGIKCDGPMVSNVITDQRHAESLVIVDSREQATQLMYNTNPMPHGIVEAYTKKGERVFRTRGGAQNILAGPDTVEILGLNVEDKIREAEEKVKVIDYQIEEVNRERGIAEKSRQEIENEKKVIQRKLGSQEQAMNGILEDVREMEKQFTESDKNSNLSEDIIEQQANVTSLEHEMKELQNQLPAAEEETAKIHKKIAPLDTKLRECINQSEGMEDKLSKIERELQRFMQASEQGKKTLADLTKMQGKSEMRIAEINAQIAALERALQENTDKALKICPHRVDVDKTTTVLNRHILTLETKIRKEQEGRKKTSVEVTKQFHDAKRRFQEVDDEMRRLLDFQERIRQHLDGRYRRWIYFRKAIARRTNILFNAFLAKKGYAGHLTFDHKAKTLDIFIQLDKMRSEKENVSRDTKSLSGGERSYSTVALLLSLWEAMETPFRAMDEFDVFMDAVNRRISMDLLINAARLHKNRQFIFITPHDFSTIKTGPDIKIHRMYPPERGQATLSEIQE